MRKEVIMPKVGLDMDEGTISVWYKQVGESVKEGEPLLSIETDKTVISVDSSLTGVLVEIIVPEGETVEITKTIAWIETDD